MTIRNYSQGPNSDFLQLVDCLKVTRCHAVDCRIVDAAETLRLRLKALGMRPADLAKALNVDRSTASLMLSGKRGIGTRHLDAIAAYVRVSVPDLFTVPSEDRAHAKSGASTDESGTARVRTGEQMSKELVDQGLLRGSASLYAHANLAAARASLEKAIADLNAVAARLPAGQAPVDRPHGSGRTARPRKRRRPLDRPPTKNPPPR